MCQAEAHPGKANGEITEEMSSRALAQSRFQ